MNDETANWCSLNYLFKRAMQNRRLLIQANLLALLATLCTVPVPLLLPLMVDEVLLERPGTVIGIIDEVFGGGHSGIFYIGVVLAVTVVLRSLGWFFGTRQLLYFLRISKNIVYQMRAALLKHLGRTSLSGYDHVGGGAVASRLVTDVNTVDDFLGATVSGFLISVLSIVATSVVVLFLHWQLAFFLLLLNPLVIYFTMMIGRRVKNLKKKENTAIEIFQQAVTETLDALHQIRASNRDEHYIGKIRDSAREVRNRSIKFAWRSDSSARLSFLVFLIGFDVFRMVGMLMVLLSDLTIGQMIAVFGYLWFMLAPIQEVLNMQYAWFGAKAALERIKTLFDMPCEPQYPTTVNPFEKGEGTSIEVRDLCLSYNDKDNILDKVNLKIEARQKVALVGASGGGKTTLIYALLGLRTPQSGGIFYGGAPIEHIGLSTVRDNISCVLQRPALLDRSIRENLLLGTHKPDDELWRVLECAQIADFVRSTERGLDTFVGVQGVKLSGGQTQRLAIARMLLSSASIVILDEATSAVDSATEKKIHAGLFKALKDRTVLIIAHRLSAVQQADHIYVFDGGRIAEQGVHADLVHRDGLYSQLFETQLRAT